MADSISDVPEAMKDHCFVLKKENLQKVIGPKDQTPKDQTPQGPQEPIRLVKIQRRHGEMVKNGQKLKKGSSFIIKTLTLEMSPIGMIQETRKKN